jgi:hypothetical protein
MGNKIQNFGIFSLLFFIFLEEKRKNCVNFGFAFRLFLICKFGLKPDVVEGHFPPQPKGWGY